MNKFLLLFSTFIFIAPLFAKADNETLVISNQIYTAENLTNKNVQVQGKSELILTGLTPLTGSAIDLQSEDAWIILKEVKPSSVKSSYLASISINGAAFVDGVNGRLAIYAQGTAVIPHASGFKPLTVFSGENYEGEALQCEPHTYYKTLGSLNNKIKSFKLKRGYMVTFANNSDGTGYSRVFTADDKDMEIPVMPAYLHGTVSFIRVLKYQWVSKKGWGGGQTDAGYLDCTWNYDWSSSGKTTANIEYVPHKHKVYWPGWGLNDMQNITHVLGINEPDRPDQANATYEAAMAMMPDFQKSGLRITSPVTSDFYNSWGQAQFELDCDANNYRMDVTTVHAYQTVGWWSANRMNDISNRTAGRPIWITEWNNGANWTNETWPGGNRLANDKNVQKQLADLKTMLGILDNHPKVERYAFYNWVEDCRALILTINDSWKSRNPDWQNYQWLKTAPVMWEDASQKIVLTPAGDYYRNNKAPIAYSKANERIPVWNVPGTTLSAQLLTNNQTIRLSWLPVNDELVGSYTIEVKKKGEFAFSELLVIPSITTSTKDVQAFDNAQYRIRVNAAKESRMKYSNIITATLDPAIETIAFTATAVSTSIIRLNWNSIASARSYKVLRSKELNGEYTVIAGKVSALQTSFQDAGLEENTSYFYKLVAVNYAGEFTSDALEIKTKELLLPETVTHAKAYSADAKVTLDWDMMLDVNFKILRSDNSESGFEEVAADLELNRWVDKNVVNNNVYYYKIYAVNDKGQSAHADMVEGHPRKNLHLYYDFEEEQGTLAYDQWGGNHATLNAGVAKAKGKYGDRAIGLNATADSYLQLPNGVVSELNDFTITAWILLTSNTANNRVFDFGNGTGEYMMLSPNVGSDVIRFKYVSGTANVSLDATKQLTLGTWTHVAVKKSGVYVSIYVDGVRLAISNPIFMSVKDMGNTNRNYIGKSQAAADPVFNGRIDDFRIYNTGLSNEEILCVMNNGSECGGATDSKNIHENSAEIDVYPNPVIDKITVSVKDNRAIQQLEVFSVSGQKMLRKAFVEKSDVNTLDVSALPRGVYFLIIECDGRKYSKQLVKI